MTRFMVIIFSTLYAIGFLGQFVHADQFMQWESGLELSVPRSGALAVAVKNYAVIAGGVLNDSLTHSDVVDVVDVTTKQISQTKLYAGRVRMVATAVGSYAIFAGGYEFITINSTTINSTLYTYVDVLDVEPMIWKRTPFPPNFNKLGLVAASTEDKVIFFNGAEIALFDPSLADESAWTLIPLNLTISQSSIIRIAPPLVKDNVVYFYGVRDFFFAFNLTSMTLVPNLAVLIGDQFASLPSSSFYIDDNIYFGKNDRLLIFSTKKNVWTMTLLPQTISSSTATRPLRDKIYVNQMGMQYLYSPASDEWQSLNFTIPANASAVTVVGDRYVIVAGGLQEGTAVATVRGLEFPPPPTPISTSEPKDQLTSGSTLFWPLIQKLYCPSWYYS